MGAGAGWLAGAELARRRLTPVVALLGSCLLLCCLVTLPDVAAGWPALSAADARLPGWAGVALVLAFGTAGLAVLSGTRVGPGPPLVLGTVVALLGLALSADVGSGAQAVLVLVLLAVATGALFGAGLSLVDEPSPGHPSLLFLCWLAPLAGGLGVVSWLALHGRISEETRLGLHPPVLALAGAAIVLLLWALVTLAVEPPRELPRGPRGAGPVPRPAGWENAWAALAFVVAAAGSAVMLVGFQPELQSSWERPVVLLVSALVACGLLLCGRVLPGAAVAPGELPGAAVPSGSAARSAYVALVVAAAAGPVSVQALLLGSARGSGSWSAWVLALLAVAGLFGVWVGWRRARLGATGGLVLVAAAAAGGWVMPATEALMCAAAAPMVAGVSMAVAGALRWCEADRMARHYVSVAGLAALLMGQLAAAPVAWALGAPLTGTADPRPGGRVLLGLAFAVCVVAAAASAVLLPPTHAPPTDSSAGLTGPAADVPQTNRRGDPGSSVAQKATAPPSP